MKETSLQALQQVFCDNLRYKPEVNLPENVSKSEMALYQSLNHHNLSDAVSPCFPIAKSLVGEVLWQQYMTAFISALRSVTPFYNDLPEAFLDFANNTKLSGTPNCFNELLHYEWLELHIELLDHDISARIISSDNLLHRALCLSPLAIQAHYNYALDKVHRGFIPHQKELFDVIVYRTLSHQVKFMRSNELTRELIHALDVDGLTLNEVKALFSKEIGSKDKTALLGFIEQAVINLVDSNILIIR